EQFKRDIPCSIGISALKGENIQQLLLMIEEILSQGSVDIDVILPPTRMDLVNMAHIQGQVHEVKYLEDGIRLKASLPAPSAGPFKRFAKRSTSR
ncbi:MAG: hypothetical protein KGJ11_03720, partial [Candidatus Omnitrophica bacterium]|nr:hypothetical protein [Candidatus Omnitrophota bacterium]